MNNPVDKRILKFISKHHVLSLSTYSENIPWSCSCFYVYDENLNRFIFTSDEDTQHAKQATLNPNISGTIVLETSMIGKIQGIQFSGEMTKLKAKEELIARKIYLKKFPFAVLIKTSMWAVHLNHIKFTDNQLGFGKKIIWKIIHSKEN